eukprot:527562_1
MGSLKFLIVFIASLCFADKITNLPGQPPVTFDQYSGYVVLNKTSNKSLFYWLQESQNNPSVDPLVLWTNGGPGCSGLIGALEEQGAFRNLENGTLAINPGSWNKFASMLYIEQPIGTGFSFSNDPNDYLNIGDEDCAADIYSMILGFLDQFPQYKTNDFYMASESYGGHFMPTTTKYIVDHNTDKSINFKGFLLGNPYTAPNESILGKYGSYYGHQLIPKPLFDQWTLQCLSGNVNASLCSTLQHEMHQSIGDLFTSGLDWPVCETGIIYPGYSEDAWFMQKVINETLGEPIHKLYERGYKQRVSRAHNEYYKAQSVLKWDPCQENYLKAYLNRADVVAALHAKPLNYSWLPCSSDSPLKYNYSWSRIPQQTNYQYLCNGNYDLKMTIYSGDDDTVCATMGTQLWMNNMTEWKLTSDGRWKPWIFEGQTGGYQTKWKCGDNQNISLVTVHSAGHEVPWFKPMKALSVFEQYLNGVFS